MSEMADENSDEASATGCAGYTSHLPSYQTHSLLPMYSLGNALNRAGVVSAHVWCLLLLL